MMMVTMHDGQSIEAEIRGEGPALLLPVNPRPAEGPQAEEMRRWGVDPALGRTLIDGLSDRFRVVAFDYEGHLLQAPKPDTLTPDRISRDFLAIADAAGASRFAYYGYSWLALAGMQLALRTDRLAALVMGGFPPLDGPYREMLTVTRATHEMAVSPRENADTPADAPAGAPADAPTDAPEAFDWDNAEVAMNGGQTQQFVTLYEALKNFDDRAAQTAIGCPRLCFAGGADKIDYGERWGGVQVDIAGPLVSRRRELESFGWDVVVLEGLDHTQAMQAANVLPVIRPWLEARFR